MDKHVVLGWLLIALGILGIVSGVIPFTTNGLRILVREDLWNVVDLASHGVEAMKLSVEWGVLSSAMGAYLGVLLVWAGRAWLKGRHSAPLLTWIYISCGLTVNVTDMIIFGFRASPGPMRSQMLVFDGIAMLIPIALAVWLIRRPRRISSRPHPEDRLP